MAAVDITCPHCNRAQKVAEHRLKETVYCLLCQQLITDVYLYKVAPKAQELTIKLKGRIVSEFGTTKLEDLKSKSDEYTGKFEPVNDDSDEVEQVDETTRIFDTGSYHPPARKRMSTAARTYLVGGLVVALMTAGVTTLGVMMLADDAKTDEIETSGGEGMRLERYPAGGKKAEWQVINVDGVEISDGPWREWHEDGADKSAGNYTRGDKVGKWQGWHANGRPSFEHTYGTGEHAGKETGLWVEWHADGRKSMEGSWIAGNKDGKWRTWFKSGGYATLEEYDNGQPVGHWLSWHENGEVKLDVAYVAGLREGKATAFHDTGAEELLETWKGGLLDGPSRGAYRNLQKSFEGAWLKGGREGEWKWWHPNSNLQRQTDYLDGLEQGLWLEWYANAVPRTKGEFDKGRRIGVWEDYDEDGELACRRVYEEGAEKSVNWFFRGVEVQRHTEEFPDGTLRSEWCTITGYDGAEVRHGFQSTYYSTGVLAETGTWVNGKRDGTWSTFDAGGNALSEERWNNGVKQD